MNADVRQCLFVELLGGIGDVLIALPAIQAIGRTYPHAQLTVLTFAPGGELLQGDPLIHSVISIDKQSHAPQLARRTLEQLLCQQTFDLIVSDTNYDGIDRLIQQSGASRTVTNMWRSPPDNQWVSDRFLDILLADGVIQFGAIAPPALHLTPAERQQAQQALGHTNGPIVVLYPEAGMPIKQWPASHFVTVGQALQRQYNATILVPIGADPALATHIAQAIGDRARLWPRGTLRELAALLSLADLTIAADTGPARIAAACQTPTITLFGPSWHGRYGQPAPHINLQGHPDCPERDRQNFTTQACWYSGHCPFDGWQTCVAAITPSAVLTAANTLLNARAATGTAPLAAACDCPTPTLSIEPKAMVSPDLWSQWSTARNILVMRLDNIGDVLMISPALRAIKDALPQAKITLMASPGGAQAATLLPWVDAVMPCRALWQDLGKLPFEPAREWELIQSLHDRQFDAAIVFTSFSQTPHPAGLVCYLAGIPLRLGESKEWGGGVFSTEVKSAPDDSHQVERSLRLIESVGFPVHDRSLGIQVPDVASTNATAHLRERGLDAAEPYILLNPWTSCQSRNYAIDRFAIAARQLADITGYRIVVTGVAKDRPHSGPLLEQLGDRAVDCIGATTLAELAALIANARLMVSNNTSTMHIADATHTPSVILFAGTEYESQWRPRHTVARLLRQPTPCSPCYAFTCPYQLECLDIPPEAVVEAGLALLHHAPQAAPVAIPSWS